MEYITSPAQAERNAATQMRALGYHDAVAVPAGPDGGIDVQSSRAVGQVKFRGASVSRPELQNLYGARGLSHEKELWFFAATSYTAGAIACGDELGMFLFTYEPHGELKPVNGHARRKLATIAAQRAEAKRAAQEREAERERAARAAEERAAAKAEAARAAAASRAADAARAAAATRADAAAKKESAKPTAPERPPRPMRMEPTTAADTPAMVRAQRAQDAFEAQEARRAKGLPVGVRPNVGPGVFGVLSGSIPAWLGWLCFEHRSGHVIVWILLVILWSCTALLWGLAASFFAQAVKDGRDRPTQSD